MYPIGPESGKSNSAAKTFAGRTYEERETRPRHSTSESLQERGGIFKQKGIKKKNNDSSRDVPLYCIVSITLNKELCIIEHKSNFVTM